MRHVRFAVLAAALLVLSLACAAPPHPAMTPGQAQPAAEAAAVPPAPAAEAAPPAPTAQAPEAVSGPTAYVAGPVPVLTLEAKDPYAGASPASNAAIEKAAALMVAGKWQSAWAAIDAFDPKNADPFALALKIEICMRGFVQTQMHQSFSLVDLEAGQSLEALRAGDGSYELFDFDPIGAAEAQRVAGVAAPPILSAALGDYFYSVQGLFPGQWFISDEEVCTRSLASYEEAAAAGLTSAESLLREGELLLRFGRNEEAETRLRAALALSPGDADGHLSLAVALAQEEKLAEAFAEIDIALAHYVDSDHRYAACLLGARIAAGNDEARSESYIAAAEKEIPEEPSPGLLRHTIAIQSGNADAARRAEDAVLDRFTESPYVVRSILTNWIQSDAVDSAMAFLDRSLVRKAGDFACLGILGFYKSLLTMEVKGPEGYAEAAAILDKAEEDFRKVYGPENEAFGAVAELRAQLTAPPESSPTEGVAIPQADTTPTPTK